MTRAASIVLDLYTREGCHLCEDMLELLEPRIRGRASLRVHDIDGDSALRERYNTRVPVLERDGDVISEYVLDADRLDRTLRQP